MTTGTTNNQDDELEKQLRKFYPEDEVKWRLLFEEAKRSAVALFKNDHDDGDTAIYQFISEVIPLINQQLGKAAHEALTEKGLREKIEEIEYSSGRMQGRQIPGGIVYDQVSDNIAIEKRVMAIKSLVTRYGDTREQEGRIDEWSLIGETMHSATIQSELHLINVKRDRLAELKEKV